MIRNFKI